MGIEFTIDLQKNEENHFTGIYTSYEKMLSSFYCKEEGESLLDTIVRQKDKSSFLHKKAELVEKLCMAGIKAEKGMSIEELEACVKKLPDGITIDKKMFDVLFDIYQSFEPPAIQMMKIVRRLGRKEYQDSSVRLAILKQFLLNTDYNTGPVKEMIRTKIHSETGQIISRRNKDNELMADWADESLFSVLTHKLNKAEKKKYALLRLCDDLAMGHFRTNGSTRHSLYMFAFAFDMVSYANVTEPEYNPDIDIEKNLFFDYYKNNMLRLLWRDEQENGADYEAAPSGEGINYKNYAEVIYLYYLNRKDLEIRERIKRAEKMIELCWSEACKKQEDTNDTPLQEADAEDDYYTYVYKDYYLERFKILAEEEIPAFILSHYLTKKINRKISGTRLMYSSENMTATYYYNAFIRRKFSNNEKRSSRVEQLLIDNPDWNPDYIRLIRKLNDMLHANIKSETQRITREKIIAAFYENSISSFGQEGLSLKDLYFDCCEKLNPILMDSRFMPLNITNIFDVFMLIMLYRYLNIV